MGDEESIPKKSKAEGSSGVPHMNMMGGGN